MVLLLPRTRLQRAMLLAALLLVAAPVFLTAGRPLQSDHNAAARRQVVATEGPQPSQQTQKPNTPAAPPAVPSRIVVLRNLSLMEPLRQACAGTLDRMHCNLQGSPDICTRFFQSTLAGVAGLFTDDHVGQMRSCWGDGILYDEMDGQVRKAEVVEHPGTWVPPDFLAAQTAAAAVAAGVSAALTAAANSSNVPLPGVAPGVVSSSALPPAAHEQPPLPPAPPATPEVHASAGPGDGGGLLAAWQEGRSVMLDGGASLLGAPQDAGLFQPSEQGPSPEDPSDLALAGRLIDTVGPKVESLQLALWNLDRIDQRALPLDQKYDYGTSGTQGTGKGVTIYAVDSGVMASHQEFRQWHSSGSRATHGFDFVDNDADTTDCDGHGTHVSATAIGRSVGVAKEANVVAVRVLDCNGSGSISNVVAGLDWVAAHAVKPAVVIMSLGVTGGAWARSLEDSVSSLLHDHGITVIVASGNSAGDSCLVAPASVPGVVTVAASNLEYKFGAPGTYRSGNGAETMYKWSNTGACVTLFAPGVEIYSACGGASRCPEVSDMAYTWASGTSMAVPHVAGVAALYLADHPQAAPSEVSAAVVRASTPDAIADVRMRRGTPNLLLYSMGVQGLMDVKAAEGAAGN